MKRRPSRSDPLLLSSAPVGARRVALRLLDETDAAAARLATPRDAEALHDFRVALRRLRTILRAYGPELADTVKRRWQRRLGALARATNDARDAEVQRERLGALSHAAPVAARACAERVAIAYRHAREVVLPDYLKTAEKLRTRLAHYRPAIALDGGGARDPHAFAMVTGRLLAAQGESFAEALTVVSGIDDASAVHAARIEGKRLRYLLEPLRRELATARDLLAACKGLQDVLGELNDVYVLLSHLATPGDPTPASEREVLRAQALVDRDRLFAEVLRLRDSGAVADLVARSSAVAAELVALGAHSQQGGRLLLLSGVPRRARGGVVQDVQQAFRNGAGLVEELRRVRGVRGEQRWRFVAPKGEPERALCERLDAAIFAKLWRLARDRRLRRRRYTIAEAAAPLISVDRLLGVQLVLAAVSAPAEAVLPKWLSRRVVRDVSGDPAFETYRLREPR